MGALTGPCSISALVLCRHRTQITRVGQCGNQIGSAFWPLALEEYGIDLHNDKLNRETVKLHRSLQPETFQSFFWVPDSKEVTFKTLNDLKLSKVKARAICVDMEDSVVAHYHTGHLRSLFDKKCLLTNYSGSGNNWAEGHFTHGSQYHEQISEMVRRTVERCDQLHGFLVLLSVGGGTGSGLGTAILKMLDEDFTHVDRFVSCVYPANTDDVITSPYNVALATNELSKHATCVFPVENKALFDICDHIRYGEKSFVKETTSFKDVNSIIVDMLLHLTSASRFPGQLNVDMNEIATNLVPFPKHQYISCSLSPISKQQKARFKMRSQEMLASVLCKTNQLLKINPLSGLVCGAAFLARGDLNLHELRKGVDKFGSKANFPQWSHSGIKVGLSSVPTHNLLPSILGLLNTTSMKCLFEDVLKSFIKLYRRKAHVHHYLHVDHFEETNFAECQENLIDVVHKYNELENCKSGNIPSLKVI